MGEVDSDSSISILADQPGTYWYLVGPIVTAGIDNRPFKFGLRLLFLGDILR